jgi:hypothetical protein
VTNTYDSTRGNVTDRQRRKLYLLETYAANTKVRPRFGVFVPCPTDYPEARDSCRCYRCGELLVYETVTVDRIVPGCVKTKRYPKGGTYCRENIRPSCSDCATKTGNALKAQLQ